MVAWAQSLFNAFSGAVGIAIIGIFLVKGIFMSIQEHRLLPVEIAIAGGAAFYSISWIMANWMQAAAG